MKFPKITVIMAFALVFISMLGTGCDSNRTSNVASPWFGGYEGLVAEFESFPGVSDTREGNVVWEDQPFPVRVHLMNKGEYTVPAHEVELELKGIARTDFSGIRFTKDNDEIIERVSEFLPNGGEEFIDFGDALYEQLTGTHYDANLYVYYTYPYETNINIPRVCYKENIKDDSICDVDSTKQAFASAGPIQVGTVTERYIGRGSILLEIPIKNVQKGKAKAHENDEFRPEWDEIYFEINDPDWECKSRGNPTIARITHPGGARSNTETTIICTNRNIEKDALYTKSITMKLKYHYQDWVEETVRIKEIPE